MTTMAEYLAQARQAIAAGDLDQARQLTEQAKALKALADMEGETAPRLPAPEPAPAQAEPAVQDVAVKSWFVQRYGELDAALAQIGRELYRHIAPSYEAAAYSKNADFVRWIRTGRSDPTLHRTVLYTPHQLADMVLAGGGVAELKSTQIESQDTLGGYLVPEDVRERIVQRLESAVVMRRFNTSLPTSRDRVTMPVVTGGDSRYPGAGRAYWVDETPTSAQHRAVETFGNVNIPVHTLMRSVPVSKNLLEDSAGALAIVRIVEQLVASAFRITEDEAFLIGNGVGQPLGVLNGTAAVASLSYGAIGTVVGPGGGTITADTIRAAPYQIDGQYRDNGGAWIMAKHTLRVIKSLKDTTGNYLWSGRGDTPQLAQGQPAALEGYPIYETETLPSTTTPSGTVFASGAYPVVFATRDCYQIIDRVGMDMQRYDDSTTAAENRISLVARRRVGGQPITPWGIVAIRIV